MAALDVRRSSPDGDLLALGMPGAGDNLHDLPQLADMLSERERRRILAEVS